MNHLLASVDVTRNGKSIEEIIQSIKSEIHLVAIDSDIFFAPEEDQKTFKIGKKYKKNFFYHEINSIHGHDAFLIENDAVSKIFENIF